MDKQLTGRRNCDQPLRCALLSLLICLLLVSLHRSLSDNSKNGFGLFVENYQNAVGSQKPESQTMPVGENEARYDPCSGRYIYIHALPGRFNTDLLDNCRSLTRGTDGNMCPFIDNLGLGPDVRDPGGVLSNGSWFRTNQFMLEVIFHNRLQKYDCLTNDSSAASAVFIPYYAGLDISQVLWNPNISVRDEKGYDLLSWVSAQAEWTRLWGRDHFLVAGRIAWDFRRQTDDSSDWGSKMMFLPESRNMTMLSVESSVWKNDLAIPYPTYFHPSDLSDVMEWQDRIRKQDRPYLFAFAGAPRPELRFTIRGEIIDQCLNSNGKCKLLNCSSETNNCDNPVNVMSVFQKSVFCLQPRGDSYTRRSTFDLIIAGCIPVFFHSGTAYVQYLWYLPKNHTKYSVYIPLGNAREGEKMRIEERLLQIPSEEVLKMREEVIKMIPSIIYANRRDGIGRFEDAFDIAVKGILERVERVRSVIRDGGDPNIGFSEQNHFKFDFPLA